MSAESVMGIHLPVEFVAGMLLPEILICVPSGTAKNASTIKTGIQAAFVFPEISFKIGGVAYL